MQMIYELQNPYSSRIGWETNEDLMKDAAKKLEECVATIMECSIIFEAMSLSGSIEYHSPEVVEAVKKAIQRNKEVVGIDYDLG